MTDPAFERLVGLISANQDDLFRYIYSLLPHPDDARDVLQETLLELTRKFAQYDETRPFLPWACRFAYHQVLRHRDRNPRKLTYLPPDLLELLAREREEEEPVLAARLAALGECLGRLPPDARNLVHGRYTARLPIEQLADDFGLSRRTICRRLEHLRRSLFECIERRRAAREAYA